MPKLERIREVINKILSVEELREHVCFFGGSIPYIITNQESNRDHSDIDVLVDEEYMDIVRDLVKLHNLYIPAKDSLNLGVDGDYGLKVFIDGVYVEFEPMSIKDNNFIRKSFSPSKQLVGEEITPFEDINDLITRVEIDGKEVMVETLEFIKVGKEKYQRDKDIEDVKFIDRQGIDEDKYLRAKTSFSNTEVKMTHYSQEKSL